ncbi:MAG: response regulator [Pseudomonadota bacterium]
MAKIVLFVDDDVILRRLIQKKFKRYKDTFTVLTAGNGLEAIEELKKNIISLVITDLQMPQMDGFALLARLTEKYPDIPVIVQTGHSTPKTKKTALKKGAAGYIEKPFKLEDLVQKIIATLKKESEGGVLQSISLEMFIQLVEMEMKTCTIRVVERKSGKQGVLFLKEGDLLDARVLDRHGKPAAYEILSWEDVTLSIQDDCPISEKKIDDGLQSIVFEAMRLKDESGAADEDFEEKVEEDVESTEAPALEMKEDLDLGTGLTESREPSLDEKAIDKEHKAPGALSAEDAVLNMLGNVIGGKKCLEYIYRDSAWNEFISRASEIGKCFEAGQLKACYIGRGEATDFVLLPGEETTVIAVNPECPRERFLEVLSIKDLE